MTDSPSSSGGPTIRRTITRNAVAGWAALILRAAVSFVLFQVLLGRLGGALFGMWLIFGDLTGHAALLRMGLSAGLLREVAHLEGAGKRARIRRLLATVQSVYCALGAALAVVMVWLAPVIVACFDVPSASAAPAAVALSILAVRMGLTFPASVLGAAMLGLRRYDAEYRVQILGNAVRFSLVLTLVAGPQSLVGLALITLGVDVIENLLRWVVLRRIAPDFAFFPGRVSKRLLRSIRGFSFDAFIHQVSVRVQYDLDNLVIGLLFGLPFVPLYEAAVKLVYTARQLMDRITESVAPIVAASVGRGGSALGPSLVRGTKVILVVGALLGLGIMLTGPAFLRFYVGGSFDAEQLATASRVLWVLTLAFLCRNFLAMSGAFLWGLARMRDTSRLFLLEAAVNCALSLLLAIPFGLVGVALGTLLPKLLTNLVFVPRWAARATGVPYVELARAARAPLRAVLVAFVLGLPCVLWIPSDLWKVLGGGAVIAAAYILVAVREHRELLRFTR